jgi:imidazole glycerol-phosphate synthase subunit HisF
MLPKRIIPVLLIQNQDLVKTKQFKFFKYVGDPLNAIKIFNDKSVDEIIVIDINVDKHTNPDYEYIEKLNNESFMPFTYGGGVKNLRDADILFSKGIEKISIQSAALNNLKLIEEISNKYGSQSLILSLDYINYSSHVKLRNIDKKMSLKDLKTFLKDFLNAGIGELFINNISKDGMKSGQDYEFISILNSFLNIPLISAGGTRSKEDMVKVFKSGADAVGIGSYFIFYGVYDAVLISYPDQLQIEKISNYDY